MAQIDGYRVVGCGNETDLTISLAFFGPIPTYIDASNPSFQFYSSGVYYEPLCTTVVNHQLLLVGYGSQEEILPGSQDFYTAKNRLIKKNLFLIYKKEDYFLYKLSWGEDWGLDGYINLSRNRDNNCGVASFASYATVQV